MRLGCEEVDMFGCGVRIDEDHEVLGTRDALGANLATKVDVNVFPGMSRPILNSGGRWPGMPPNLCSNTDGACQWG